MTLEQAEVAVARRVKMEAEHGYAPFIIHLRDNDEFIGSGGVVSVKDSGETEIVYHFLPSAWGKGYATEAATAILEFEFKTAKLEEIIGLAFPDNIGSCRVMEKIGMRYLGLATYLGLDGLMKYVANRATWTSPQPFSHSLP